MSRVRHGPDTQRQPKATLPSVGNAISLVMLIGLLTFLAFRFDIDFGAIWDRILQSNVAFYFLGLALYYLSFLFRGIRWREILRNSGWPGDGTGGLPSTLACTRLVLMGRFADSVMWLRLGNLYRAYQVSGNSGHGFARGLGTLIAEHFLDLVITTAVILGLAALFVGGAESEVFSYVAAIAIGGTLIAGAALFGMGKFGSRLAAHLPPAISNLYRPLHDGTLNGLRRRNIPVLVAPSLGIWLCSVGRWFFVLQALGVSISVPLLLFIVLVNAVLASIPITPGGLGVVESGTIGVLMLELTADQATSVTLVERSISYLSVIVIGAVLLLAHEIARRRGASASPQTGQN